MSTRRGRSNNNVEVLFGIEREENGEWKEIILCAEGYCSPFVPAKTWGPPEDCYPAEGGEVEIGRITVNGEDWNGELTAKERERLEECIADQYANQIEAYEDDRGDYEYDRWKEDRDEQW